MENTIKKIDELKNDIMGVINGNEGAPQPLAKAMANDKVPNEVKEILILLHSEHIATIQIIRDGHKRHMNSTLDISKDLAYTIRDITKEYESQKSNKWVNIINFKNIAYITISLIVMYAALVFINKYEPEASGSVNSTISKLK